MVMYLDLGGGNTCDNVAHIYLVAMSISQL